MPDRFGDDDLDPTYPTEIERHPESGWTPDVQWAAEQRAQTIVNCSLCDDDGYTGACLVCDHVDHGPGCSSGDGCGAAGNGMEAMNHPDMSRDETINPSTDRQEARKMAEISTQSAAITKPDRRPPHGCGQCDARWSGFLTSHCGGCHRTFSGLTAFDLHRDGSHSKGTRHCVDPESVGLVENSRVGYVVWGQPNDGTEWWAES